MISLSTDIPYFDDTVGILAYCSTLYSTQERLLQGDWARGPAGTGETDWLLPGANRLDFKTGALADSWQIPQQGTIIFHIRKGVHWQNTPPTDARNLVGGREMTVDDVVFSLNRAFTTKGSYLSTSYAGMSKSTVVTSDKTAGTVTVTCPSIRVDQFVQPDS